MNKYVEKKIDRVRKFRLSMSAQKRIENHFTCAFGKVDHENLRAEDFSYMIYATLEQKDRDSLSEDDFFNLLDENMTLKEIYGLFQEITEAAFGKNEIPVVEEVENSEDGIGTTPFGTLS